MRIAVITMVHNEHQVLPIWLRYYGGQVGEENLLVCENHFNMARQKIWERRERYGFLVTHLMTQKGPRSCLSSWRRF